MFPRGRSRSLSLQFHAALKALVISMEVLQRFFRMFPAVVTAAVVEVDEPEAFHFDTEGHDVVRPAMMATASAVRLCTSGSRAAASSYVKIFFGTAHADYIGLRAGCRVAGFP